MRDVWLVTEGQYSDRMVMAVCSSYEQACGVAVLNGWDEDDAATQMWEEGDENPPYRLMHTCLVREGRDSHRPDDVVFWRRAIAVDAPTPAQTTAISTQDYRYRWARADNYPSAEEAEMAARTAYGEVWSQPAS